MITTIKFTDDWRCFSKDEQLVFFPGVNLLVGDQGCGKSSLLTAIRNCGSKLSRGDRGYSEKKQAELVTTGVSKTYTFDFERDNYRTKGYFDGSIGFHISAMYQSHGEVNNCLLEALGVVENSVCFIDEPDMALSIRSVLRLAEILKDLAKPEKGNQVIAAVHNPFLIAEFEQVLSLEHRRWMTSEEFIAAQQGPRVETKVSEVGMLKGFKSKKASRP